MRIVVGEVADLRKRLSNDQLSQSFVHVMINVTTVARDVTRMCDQHATIWANGGRRRSLRLRLNVLHCSHAGRLGRNRFGPETCATSTNQAIKLVRTTNAHTCMKQTNCAGVNSKHHSVESALLAPKNTRSTTSGDRNARDCGGSRTCGGGNTGSRSPKYMHGTVRFKLATPQHMHRTVATMRISSRKCGPRPGGSPGRLPTYVKNPIMTTLSG